MLCLVAEKRGLERLLELKSNQYEVLSKDFDLEKKKRDLNIAQSLEWESKYKAVIEKKVNALEREILELKEDKIKQTSSFRDLEREHKRLLNEALTNEIKQGHDNLQQDYETLGQDYATLSQDYTTLTQDYEEQNKALQVELKASEEKNKALKVAFKTVEDEKKALEAAYNALEEQHKALEVAFKVSKEQNTTLEEKKGDETEKLRIVQEKFETLQEQHKSLEYQFEAVEKSLIILAGQNKALKVVSKALEGQNMILEQKKGNDVETRIVQAKFETLQEQYNRLEQQFESLEDYYKNVKEESKKLKEDHDILKEDYEKLKTKYFKSEKNFHHSEKYLKRFELEKKNKMMSSEHFGEDFRIKEQINHVRQEAEALQREKEELADDLTTSTVSIVNQAKTGWIKNKRLKAEKERFKKNSDSGRTEDRKERNAVPKKRGEKSSNRYKDGHSLNVYQDDELGAFRPGHYQSREVTDSSWYEKHYCV